ncbi:hypothetical protein D3C81_1496560 [compost metagenome]
MHKDIDALLVEQRRFDAGIEADDDVIGANVQRLKVRRSDGRVVGNQHHPRRTAQTVEKFCR